MRALLRRLVGLLIDLPAPTPGPAPVPGPSPAPGPVPRPSIADRLLAIAMELFRSPHPEPLADKAIELFREIAAAEEGKKP